MEAKTNVLALLAMGVLLVVIVLAIGQCALGPEKAVQALQTMGFRDIKVTDSHPYAAEWNGCGKGDAVAHEATATNANGQRVSVVVCCGMVTKGCTVRTQ